MNDEDDDEEMMRRRRDGGKRGEKGKDMDGRGGGPRKKREQTNERTNERMNRWQPTLSRGQRLLSGLGGSRERARREVSSVRHRRMRRFTERPVQSSPVHVPGPGARATQERASPTRAGGRKRRPARSPRKRSEACA